VNALAKPRGDPRGDEPDHLLARVLHREVLEHEVLALDALAERLERGRDLREVRVRLLGRERLLTGLEERRLEDQDR
jgi:hypothetical protein